LLIALSLEFFKGGVEEDPDSDIVAVVGERWRHKLNDLQSAYQNAQGHKKPAIVDACVAQEGRREFEAEMFVSREGLRKGKKVPRRFGKANNRIVEQFLAKAANDVLFGLRCRHAPSSHLPGISIRKEENGPVHTTVLPI